jgi:hypothetical protein
MSRRRVGVAWLVVVAGCGIPVPDVATTPTPIVQEEGLPEGDLAHPRTVTWARRLCAKLARRPAAALGLVPPTPMPRVESILVEHGVPRQLRAVPAVESGYRRHARGRNGELGLWQLKPATARRFGIEVNRRRDDRAHVDHSTRAAARYLAYLHARYGDWALALAAYNAGEGRIDRALARRPGSTFWELADTGALPPVSCDYVPKIFAVARVTAGACFESGLRPDSRA